MADNPLSAIIEQLEKARLDFWDNDIVRATAARFLLVVKAYAAVEQLPRDLLALLNALHIDDRASIEAVRQQVASLGSEDQAQSLALACLTADMQVHLLVLSAKSLTSAGQFFQAAEAYREAEETRRAMEQRLPAAPDSERKAEHEWHDLATLYPDLPACMEDVFRRHATQTEPLQLAQVAIGLAQVGDGAGAERALAIAQRWTEGQGPILPILERLAGYLPRWPAVREAILHGPHNPVPALDQLKAWIDDPQRQMLSQLLAKPSQDVMADDTLRSAIQRVVGDEWVTESQTDMQAVLALRLIAAVVQEDHNELDIACHQIRDAEKYLGVTKELQQHLDLLLAWEEARLSAFDSSLREIAPFREDPAIIGSEVSESLEARRQLHQSIVDQIKPLAGADEPATDAHPEETVATEVAIVSQVEHAQGMQLPAEAMPGASPLDEGAGAADIKDALPGRNGSAQADPLADVYRSLRGERFSKAAEQLRTAGSSTTDAKERARIGRLAVVAQACIAALDAGSNPSPQAVEDLIQAVGCLDADSGLHTSLALLDWVRSASGELHPGLEALSREIEYRSAFRNFDRLLAQGLLIEAAKSLSPIQPMRNGGSTSGRSGSDIWSDFSEDKKALVVRLGESNPTLKLLAETSEAVLGYVYPDALEDALSKLANPLRDAMSLREPKAYRIFHPLAFWLNQVLTSWRDVRSLEAADRIEQSLLVLQQARLTCDHARAVTVVADFGDSLEQFGALVSKLDDEIHTRRRTLCDGLLGQLTTAPGSNASLAAMDRLLSSVIACQQENIDQRQIPDALRQLAAEQERLGDGERGSKPYGIEQLASAAPFYQNARLLALFEEKNQAPSSVTPGQSLAEKLADGTTKARQIRRLQADFDNARRDSDGSRAKALLIEANNADLKLQEPGSVEEWDYVIESKRVLQAQNERSSLLDDLINQLWSPTYPTVADGELVL
jgi:hypothetical protein